MSDRLEKWAPRVYRFAFRLTADPHAADDLTQETLLRAWRRREWLRDPMAIRIWLFRIAANLWRDRLRREQSPVEQATPLDESVVADELSSDWLVCHKEDLARALGSLDSLPDRQRQVLYLNACEDLSAAEIAEVLDIRAEAVRSSLSAARKQMRELLPDLFPKPASAGRTS